MVGDQIFEFLVSEHKKGGTIFKVGETNLGGNYVALGDPFAKDDLSH